jgi:zinc/manganese transport system ATP-binding protein
MTIRLDNLSAGYDRHPAIHHVSGGFVPARLTAVVGPNGGGKSTLLKALMGFLPAMSGRIDFNGVRPGQIAYLPQQSETDRHFPLTVLDVVALGFWPKTGAFRSVTPAQREAARRALGNVGMGDFAERPIEAMSTGQWRRVLFARLMLQDARVLILDEPFAGVDARTAQVLIKILEQWRGEGRTVIAVMHDLEMVRACFDESLLIARELVAWGPTPQALTDVNLARANALAEKWAEEAEACQLDKRLSA